MGKYASLRDTLDPMPQDQTWQTRINVRKSHYNGLNVAKLGEEYNKVRAQKEKLKAELEQVNTEEEALQQLIISGLEESGFDKVVLTDGTSLSLQDTPFSQIQNRESFLNWIRQSGKEHLLTVNYQTMNSMVKELLLAGQPTPPGVKAFIKTSLYRRRS